MPLEILESSAATRVFESQGIGDVPVAIRALPGQSGNLLEFRGPTNNVLASIGPTGIFSGAAGDQTITGALTVTGTATIGGQILGASGTAALPGISFSADPNTGMYRFASDVLGFAVGGGVSAILATNFQIAGGFYSGASAGSPDVKWERDAANIWAMRNTTNAQLLRIYNTFTNSTNFERLIISWQETANEAHILTDSLGTGSNRRLILGTNGTSSVRLRTNTLDRWTVDGNNGHFSPGTDNAYDVGSATGPLRIKSLFAGTNLLLVATAPGTSGVGVLGIGNGTEPSTSPADMIQFYSVDIAAGRATLGLRTEEAVAADIGLVSTHSHIIRINGANFKVMLVAV